MQTYKKSELQLLFNLTESQFYALCGNNKIRKQNRGQWVVLDEALFNENYIKSFFEKRKQDRHKRQAESLHKHMQNRTEEQKEAFRQTMSKASHKMWQNEEYRKNHRNGCIAAQSTPEARAKNSAAQLKRYENKEAHDKLSEAQKKSWQNKEHRQHRILGLQIANSKETTHINRSNALKRVWQNENFRKQRIDSVRKAWSNEDLRKSQSEFTKELWTRPEHRQKVCTKLKEQWNDPKQRAYLTEVRRIVRNKPETIQKMYETKKKNGTFTTSKWQKEAEKKAIEKFGINDVLSEYRSNEYPYKADLYIKHLHLYIELHYCPFHNKRPFDINNEEHLQDIINIKIKANNLRQREHNDDYNYYDHIIKTWTYFDVKKATCAKNNNLNWIAFYKVEDFNNWLNSTN